MGWLPIAAACLTASAYVGALLAVNGRRRVDEPPLVRGAIPFLGVAVPFGRDAMDFLRRTRERHGDVFTLVVGGQRMTFILDPMSLPAVLKADPLRFTPIADEVMDRAFGVPINRELPGIEELERASKLYLKNPHLGPLTARMQAQLDRLLPALVDGHESLELYRFTSDSMFAAAVEAVFGHGSDDAGLAKAFADFDRDFPLMVAGLPSFMVRDGAAGLDYLSAALVRASSEASEWLRRREAILQADSVSSRTRGRMQTSVLWAAQANTIPAAFWTLAHLVSDQEALAAVRREIDALDRDELSAERLDSLRVLDSAIRESLRLSSGSLTVRRVMEDFVLDAPCGRWALRAGDRVCIAPFLQHRDPEIFDEPERYRFDRFYVERGVKQFFKGGERVPMPLMPFGAGVSMCPGRFFALNEIKLFVAQVLSRLELELADPDAGLPGFDLGRVGLGIYPPARELRVRARARAR